MVLVIIYPESDFLAHLRGFPTVHFSKSCLYLHAIDETYHLLFI